MIMKQNFWLLLLNGSVFCFAAVYAAEFSVGQQRLEVRVEPVEVEPDRPDETDAEPAASSDAKDAQLDLPFKKSGSIEKIADQTVKFVDVQLNNGQFKFEFADTYEAVDPVIDEIRSQLGYGPGNNSSSYGGNTFSFSFSTESLQGTLERKGGRKESTTRLSYRETEGDKRQLLVEQVDDQLTITLNGGGVPYLFRLSQNPNSIVVQEVDRAQVFSCHAKNFDELAQAHSDYTETRLLPILKRLGLGSLQTAYQSDVQSLVLSSLSELTQEEQAQFISLAGEVDAPSFAKRTAATEKLTQAIKDNRQLILKVLAEPEVSPETRYRIQSVFEQVNDSSIAESIRYANQSGLAEDLDYLFWMLARPENSQSFNLIAGRIFSLLGDTALPDGIDTQGLEASPSNQSWYAARVVSFNSLSRVQGIPVDQLPDPIDDKGPFDKGREQFGHFLRLKLENDGLMCDTDHWKKLFGDESIDELSNQVEQLLTESNLPKAWYTKGGDRPAGLGYAQVHAELLAEKISSGNYQQQNHHYGRQNSASSRMYQNENFSISVDQKNQRRSSFEFDAEEHNAARRQLTLRQEGKRLSIRFVSGESNTILQIVSEDDVVYLHDLRGSRAIAFQADSFSELLRQNRDYLRNDFFPVIESLGIQIDPSLLAPADDAQ